MLKWMLFLRLANCARKYHERKMKQENMPGIPAPESRILNLSKTIRPLEIMNGKAIEKELQTAQNEDVQNLLIQVRNVAVNLKRVQRMCEKEMYERALDDKFRS